MAPGMAYKLLSGCYLDMCGEEFKKNSIRLLISLLTNKYKIQLKHLNYITKFIYNIFVLLFKINLKCTVSEFVFIL